MNFIIGQEVSVSVKALYNLSNDRYIKYGGTFAPNFDRNEDLIRCDYYDASNRLACMDGEVCTVFGGNGDGDIVLKNDNGDEPIYFILSAEEAQAACSLKND